MFGNMYCVFSDPPPCNGIIEVKPTPMMKGGVSFVKLVVDNTKPVEINFPVDPLVEIDKIKWTINQHPIDVDENDDNDAVYWKRDASGVTLVIRYPSMCWVYALIFLNIPMQVFLS